MNRHSLLRRSARPVVFALAAGFALLALALPAAAQRTVPVVVENDATQPVPVYQTGRMPYQFRFSVSTSNVEDCDVLTVPDGMVLTVTTIGADAQVDDSGSPEVYVRMGRTTTGSGSWDRFHLNLKYEYASSSYRYYSGLVQTQFHSGAADDPVLYTASICVGAPPTGTSSLRGFVSGYLEPAVLVDGNALP